jgi:CBS domain-containing protein
VALFVAGFLAGLEQCETPYLVTVPCDTPAFPLDGGRVLRALLALRLDYARATRIAGRMGQGMAVLFALVGLWANPLLLLIAVFVWLGAAAEMRSAEIRSKLAGVPVDQAMVTDFRVLTPGTTLGSAAQHLLSGSQAEFPVVRDGDLVGVLDSQRLLAGLRAGGPSQAVAEFMVPAAATAAPEEPLDDVLARLTGDGTRTVVVLSGDRLVGLITMDNVSELIEIRGVLQNWTAERRLPSMPPPLPARLGAARELPV